MIDFLIVGLPRSGTTWLSALFTNEHALCLHDPFAKALPEDWQWDTRKRGVSCTGAYLMPAWRDTLGCPVAVIERDPKDCAASLERIGLPANLMPERLREVRGRRWQFTDLWNETKVRELWAFLLPGVPFDAPRYRLLRDLRIEPADYSFDPAIAKELARRGLFVMEDTRCLGE